MKMLPGRMFKEIHKNVVRLRLFFASKNQSHDDRPKFRINNTFPAT